MLHPPENDGLYKSSTPAIDYVTDVALGFFTVPFLLFIFATTKIMVKDPKSLSDGVAFLYIALLTGIYYLLSKKQPVLIQTSVGNILFMLFGFSLYLGAYFLL